jgi:hypothetical protein
MSGSVFLIALAVWALLTGLFAVTNFRVEWGPYLLGFAALLTGVAAVVLLVRGGPRPAG